MMTIEKPKSGDYAEYYGKYIALADYNYLAEALQESKNKTVDLIQSIPADKEDHRYAKDKWTIKSVLAHVIDCERVFAYRALRFSRKDPKELQGFEENDYAETANTNGRTLNDIKDEYLAVRSATITLYNYMSADMLDFRGMANKNPFTARSLGWMIAGHNIHHYNIIKERYL